LYNLIVKSFHHQYIYKSSNVAIELASNSSDKPVPLIGSKWSLTLPFSITTLPNISDESPV
jgi:hypothetical protein